MNPSPLPDRRAVVSPHGVLCHLETNVATDGVSACSHVLVLGHESPPKACRICVLRTRLAVIGRVLVERRSAVPVVPRAFGALRVRTQKDPPNRLAGMFDSRSELRVQALSTNTRAYRLQPGLCIGNRLPKSIRPLTSPIPATHQSSQHQRLHSQAVGTPGAFSPDTTSAF